MKTFKHIACCLVTTTVFTSFVNAQVVGTVDLSTGINDISGAPIPYGSTDDTWTASGPGSAEGPDRPGAYWPTRVCSNLSGNWAVSGCARWITPYLETGGIQPSVNAYTGICSYRRIFSLDPSCMDWAQVNFSYIGGDNKIIGFKLNGHSYSLNPPTSNDYSTLTQNVSFAVNTSHLMAGENTIVIQVNNYDTYTGFFACGGLTISFCSPTPASKKMSISKIEDGAGNFKISPNPGKGILSLVVERSVKGSVDVLDMTGRKVYNFKLQEAVSIYPMDLSTLSKGIYMVNIRTEQSVETKKIVLE